MKPRSDAGGPKRKGRPPLDSPKSAKGVTRPVERGWDPVVSGSLGSTLGGVSDQRYGFVGSATHRNRGHGPDN